MTIERRKTWIAAAALAIALALQIFPQVSAAADALARARQLAAPARAYPELAKISGQVADLILAIDASASHLQQYRKARVRSWDRRYSALTREFNQERNRVSDLERKLEKAPPLNRSRFPPPDMGRGSAPSSAYEKMMANENAGYEQAKAQLRQALKQLSNYYDQQLRIISDLHG